MKLLSRIIFVNWYLFEANEWMIKGNTALLGQNGAGKSSFIDAIQYVMLGGSRRDWRPNAKAPDSKSKRDIRGYALGIVKDEDSVQESAKAVAEFEPRNDALTRIVLVFRDEESNEPTTIGCAISARRDEKNEEVEGFFVVEGIELTLNDFLVHENESASVPKSFAGIKELIKDRGLPGRHFLFGREPDRFVTQMLHSLTNKEHPASAEKFRRAFKQSVTMTKLDGSVSDFVKNSILEAEPLDIEKTLQSRESWRKKLQAVRETNDQIQTLSEITQLFGDAQSKLVRAAAYEWCVAELLCNQAIQELEGLQDQMEKQWQLVREARSRRKALVSRYGELSEARDALRLALDSDKNEATVKSLEGDLAAINSRITRDRDDLNELKGVLTASDTLALHANRYSAEMQGIANELGKHAQDCAGEWPLYPEKLDQAIQQCTQRLDPEYESVLNDSYDASRLLEATKKAVQELQGQLQSIEQHGVSLTDDTQLLIRLLAEQGIEARPICELIEVSEPRWQPAIEAFLGLQTQALIVPPAQAQKAVSIYRALKKDGTKAILVNTFKVQSWKDDAKPGTAATLIRGDDALAIAYLTRLLGNVDLVEETRDLMHRNRAITPDGMSLSQGAFRKMRLPKYPQLGKAAVEQTIERLKREIVRGDKEAREQDRELADIKAAAKALLDYKVMITHAPSAVRLKHNILGLTRRGDELSAQIEAIDLSATDDLRRELEEVSRKLSEVGGERDKALKDIERARANSSSFNRQRRATRDSLKRLDGNRKAIRERPGFDGEVANEILAKIEEESALSTADDFHAAVESCQNRQKSSASAAANRFGDGKQKLAVYNLQHSAEQIELPEDTDLRNLEGIAEPVKDYLVHLEGIGIHTRMEEVEDAKARLDRLIREDLAIRLRNQINRMRARFDHVNRELRDRPFSSEQTYHFRYEPKREFEDFLRYVKQANEITVANVGSLFDEEPPEVQQVLDLMDSDNKEDAELVRDYRNYFVFDIEIIDSKYGIRERLSRRIGSNSGGEQRTPFYVAMGASMASAYRIERDEQGRLEGGLCLVLADEAFQNMDEANTFQAADYLRSIGLQCFFVGPDEAEPRMSAVADTVMYFIRDGAAVTVDVNFIKEPMRKLFEASLVSSEGVVSEVEA